MGHFFIAQIDNIFRGGSIYLSEGGLILDSDDVNLFAFVI